MKKILVIEDSKTINNIISKELSVLGFEVSQAFKLAEAKDFLAKEIYNLIILDLHLPDGEGSELIANIQSLTKTKVVVLTSSQDSDLREELFQYGILDYIIKDKNLMYSINEIVKIINSTIETKIKDKILVIDDSKFICKQIKTILEPRNYNVKTAYTARSAFSKLHKEKFELIILDMELPDMHGIRVLEYIRKDKEFMVIPVLVLSGTSTPDIIRNVLKNGANDFLKKPFVYEEFILKVDLWIDYFKKEKELIDKTAKLKSLNEKLEELVDKKVAENKEKERMLFLQSRHAQMGEMISMIAHQWRQPLNAIGAAMGVLNIKAKSNKLTKETVFEITKKVDNYLQYLSSTINDFRNFFQPEKEKHLTDLETIVQKTLALIKDSLDSKNISISVETKNVVILNTYENELVQVILNIIKNAEDALIENKIKEPKIKIIIDGNKIIIKDNAKGIPKKIIEKIFDPYFSTKIQKNGTGLGLYMSKIILEKHCNGNIKVYNDNDGAVFEIIVGDTK